MRRIMIILATLVFSIPAFAEGPPGTTTMTSPKGFDALVKSLDAAVKAEGFFVVTRASASYGASNRGIAIRGNMVVGVFRNDFAVRMLDASIAAGIEAPLRFYITENTDGTASLTYRHPSQVFASYEGGDALKKMAAELDVHWARMAEAAVR